MTIIQPFVLQEAGAMAASITSSRRGERRSGRPGFTLVELSVAFTFIAAGMAILLPVFNPAKQVARRLSAASDLRQVLVALSEFEQEWDGRLPPDLTESVLGLDTLPTPLKPYLPNYDFLVRNLAENRYNDGLADYVYLYPPLEPHGAHGFDGTFQSLQDPSETVVIFGKVRDDDSYLVGYADVHIEEYVGADSLPHGLSPDLLYYSQAPSMLARAAGAAQFLAAVLEALDTDQADVVPQLAASLRSPQTLQFVFNSFDADQDGQLRIEEVVNYDLSGFSDGIRPILGSFLVEMSDELLPDADPDGSLSVSFEEFREAAAEDGLFSFNSARSLTAEFVTNAGVANALNVKLDAAESAGRRGQGKVKAKLLQEYVHALGVQTGATVSTEQAETLQFILRGL